VALIVTSFVLFSALSSTVILSESGTSVLTHSPATSSLSYNGAVSPSAARTPFVQGSGLSSALDSWQSIGYRALSGSPSIESPVATYNVNFTAANKLSGESWSVYVYTNLALSIPDLPLYNMVYHGTYGLVFSSSSSTSSISGSIASGTYYYYAGPSSTLSGPYKLIVSGAKSVSVVFPTFYNATFTESGLTSGTSWSVYATSNQYNGNMTILSKSSASSTITASLPNGYYSFAFGTGSTVIESYSFAVSGSNVNKQINFPALHPIVFKESGLSTGSTWQLFGETTSPNSF